MTSLPLLPLLPPPPALPSIVPSTLYLRATRKTSGANPRCKSVNEHRNLGRGRTGREGAIDGGGSGGGLQERTLSKRARALPSPLSALSVTLVSGGTLRYVWGDAVVRYVRVTFGMFKQPCHRPEISPAATARNRQHFGRDIRLALRRSSYCVPTHF